MKKVGKAVFGAAKKAAKAVVKAVKTVAKYVKKGAQWVGGKAKGVFQKIAKSKIGKAIVAAVKKGVGAIKKVIAKVKGWIDKGKKKWREWREKRKGKKKPRATPQERLEKALSLLRPKVAQRFSRGVSALRLRTTLLFWRARYRLSRLSLVSTGDTARVIAKVNPEGEAGQAPRLTGAAIRKLVHDVVVEIENDPELQQAAAFQSSQPGTKDKPIIVTPGKGVLAQGQSLRARGVPSTGPDTRVYSALIEGETVGEKAGGAANTLVLTSNQFVAPYGWIGEDLKRSGLAKEDVSFALRTLVQTGQVPPGMEEHTSRLHELQRLLFASEAARSKDAALYAAMGVSIAGREDSAVTYQDLFGQKSGERTTKKGKLAPVYSKGQFPSSLRGARSAQEQLEKGIEGDPNYKPRRAGEKRVARAQEALAEAWLVREGLYDLCARDLEAGKQMIKQRLLEWFRGRK